MTKSTKIMLAVIGSVLAVCIIITAVVSFANGGNKSDPDPNIITTGGPVSDVSAPGETQDAQSSEPLQPEQPTQSNPGQTTGPAVSQLKEQIIGKWSDSANMSGYEFFENGTVTVTYVNLTVPILNMPINGTATGSYTLDGNTLTMKYSIYSRTITDSFTASVENNTLTLKDNNGGDIATYARSSSLTATEAGTSGSGETGSGIIGTWVNSDGSIRYIFNENGTVKISYSNTGSSSAMSSSYSGVYLIKGNKITIQYTLNGQKVTQEYSFMIVGNSMSLTDSAGGSTILVRGANSFVSTDAEDLVGTWTDGSGMSGYEFKQGNQVEITYVNFTIPVINMPINGTYSGTYSVSGNRLTVRASIYSRTVVDTYTFEISGNTLTLKNTDNGDISTYIKK